MEKVYLEEFDFKGIDALSNRASFEKGYYEDIVNMVKSKSSTLRKREGYQQEGQPISATEISQLDRYITSEVETLIASTDQKVYYRKNTALTATTFSLHATSSATPADHYFDSVNKTMVIKFTSHNFLIGDNIYVTVSGQDYIYTVEDVALTTITISQIVSDLSTELSGIVFHGGRVSDTLPVASSTGIVVGDMLSIEGFNRHFKVLTVVSGTSIQIDEEIYVYETSTIVPDIYVSEKWTQFTTASNSIQDETIFDASAIQNPISSSMLRKNMFMTDGDNEPLFFDGADIERLGFHEVPPTIYVPVGSITAATVHTKGTGYAVGDIIEVTQAGASGGTFKVASLVGGGDTGILTVTLECGSFGYAEAAGLATVALTGAGSGGKLTIPSGGVTSTVQRAIPCSNTGLASGLRSYKLCYERVDNNGEVVQSGFTYKFDYTNPNLTGCIIPVVVIPKGINNNLLYNVDKCYVDLFRTTINDIATFYKTIQTPMNTFSNFHITGITAPSSNKCVITLASTPTITDLVVGTYVMLWGFADSNNNGAFKIYSIDNANHTITIYKAAGTVDTTGTNIKGYGCVCIRDNSSDDILLTYNEEAYTNNGNEENNEAPPIASCLTTWDNKLWMFDIKTYQQLDLTLSSIYGDTLYPGDFIEIYKNSVSAPNLLETYEIVSSAAAASGNIRVSVTGVVDAEKLVRTLGQAINSKASGIFYAAYGDSIAGNGKLLLTERQRSSDSYIIRFKLTTAHAGMIPYILNSGLPCTVTSSGGGFSWTDITATQVNYTARAAYSKDQKPASFVGPLASGATALTYFEDIIPEDGQKIICARPINTILVAFKEDSCYRITKNSDASYLVETIDTEIGCIAPRSAVCIGSQIIFVSRTGIFSTDGYKCSPIGDKMLRNWQLVDKNYVNYAAAFHYTKERQYIVTLPFREAGQDTQDYNNYAFVYDYSEGHWSKFSNFDMAVFCKIHNDVYMGNYDGQVFKMRILESETDFRDDSTAIEAIAETRWIDLDNKSGKKLFQFLVSHLYQDSAPCSGKIYYAVDFGMEFKYLGEVTIPSAPWGNSEWGYFAWGSQSVQKTRHPLNPQRVNYVKFKFVNSNIDEVLELQGFTIEGKQLNTEGVPQIKE